MWAKRLGLGLAEGGGDLSQGMLRQATVLARISKKLGPLPQLRSIMSKSPDHVKRPMNVVWSKRCEIHEHRFGPMISGPPSLAGTAQPVVVRNTFTPSPITTTGPLESPTSAEIVKQVTAQNLKPRGLIIPVIVVVLPLHTKCRLLR